MQTKFIAKKSATYVRVGTWVVTVSGSSDLHVRFCEKVPRNATFETDARIVGAVIEHVLYMTANDFPIGKLGIKR